MTRFSVIVPMHSTESFVDECLSSARQQSGADLEIIAVDDDSPDTCGAIGERHARADGRVTTLHLTRSEGVGPARNRGIARASGEYLLFLDSDDTYRSADVLAGLDTDLAATGDPDILVFDYEERRPCGLVRPINLGLGGPRAVSADERTGVLRSSWVCWNKAYRRDFVAAAGLWFPTGYYEDFAWSISAMLAADRLAVSPRVGVRYRRCRTTSISQLPSPRHLEVFDQFERVLAFLAVHPEHDSAETRTALVTSMRSFLRSRTDRLRVVPPEHLDEFRRRTAELTAQMAVETDGGARGASVPGPAIAKDRPGGVELGGGEAEPRLECALSPSTAAQVTHWTRGQAEDAGDARCSQHHWGRVRRR